jgi:hypothetical protein
MRIPWRARGRAIKLDFELRADAAEGGHHQETGPAPLQRLAGNGLDLSGRAAGGLTSLVQGGRRLERPDGERLTDGEMHYVWWFIQGSIMETDVRRRLRRGWGLCERHAWGTLAAEAAFRHSYFHGAAVLYRDLMERAQRGLQPSQLGASARIAWRLRPAGPCLMCEMDLTAASAGAMRTDVIEQGRNLAMIREFAGLTRAHWEPTVCGTCVGDEASVRCRPHLVEAIRDDRSVDWATQRALVADILGRLAVYARSYRAALLSAVGWCSGWPTGLAFIT